MSEMTLETDVSHVGGKGPNDLGHHFCLPECILVGSWSQWLESQIELSYSDVDVGILATRPKFLSSSLPLKNVGYILLFSGVSQCLCLKFLCFCLPSPTIKVPMDHTGPLKYMASTFYLMPV